MTTLHAMQAPTKCGHAAKYNTVNNTQLEVEQLGTHDFLLQLHRYMQIGMVGPDEAPAPASTIPLEVCVVCRAL